MAENSKIEWTDHTINFWWGCEKVSPGCANCYAETFSKRVGDDIWGRGKPRRWIKSAADMALKLNNKAGKERIRYRVFCQSMSDFFEADHGQPIIDNKGNVLNWTLTSLRQHAFQIIDQCQNLDWLLVTKRPENIRNYWSANSMIEQHPDDTSKAMFIHSLNCPGYCDYACGGVDAPVGVSCDYRPNAWLLTSVENQEQADKRIPELLKCRDLSPVLGLSMEPLLGPVDLTNRCRSTNGYKYGPEDRCTKKEGHTGTHNAISPGWGDDEPCFTRGIDWVIVGGESGPGARPMHPDWVRSIRDQCKAAGVPFFFKQWGNFSPATGIDPEKGHDVRMDIQGRDVTSLPGLWDEEDAFMFKHRDKKKSGRLLDGIEHNNYQEVK